MLREPIAGGWNRRLARMSERRPLPSQMTVEQLRERVAEYRRMAETARARGSADSLLRLAERCEAMAERKERQGLAEG
jgi:KaiC/GvpD/RAD55 family RecA-like ATPase